MALPYQKAGLTLSRVGAGKAPMVKALQRDLRALGYLGHSIDGNFGGEPSRLVVEAAPHQLVRQPRMEARGARRAARQSGRHHPAGAGKPEAAVRRCEESPARARCGQPAKYQSPKLSAVAAEPQTL
jgi:hypothetical protein